MALPHAHSVRRQVVVILPRQIVLSLSLNLTCLALQAPLILRGNFNLSNFRNITPACRLAVLALSQPTCTSTEIREKMLKWLD
jgi:hypothetical protein